jgi:hypothetical protein
MTEGVDYLVSQAGLQTRVSILSIPAEALSPDPLYTGTYEFQVSYTIHPGDVKYELIQTGFNMRFWLFKDLLEPYFSHAVASQKLISGDLPGGDKDITTDKIGIQLHKAPYSATIEYENRQSDLDPSQRWRAELYYSKTLTPTITVAAKVFFTRETRESPSEEVVGQEADATPEDSFGGDVRLTKQLTRINLFFTTSAAYFQRTGLINGYGFSSSNSLNWIWGRLSLTLGANIRYNESEAIKGTQNQLGQYYYLRLKRKLF